MSFSNNFKEVLDAICDKLGIVVDWSNTNAIPYLMELSEKIINYEIYTSIAWLFLAIGILIIGLVLLIKEKEDLKDGYLSGSIAIGMFCILAFVFIAGVQVGDIITALTLPEKTIINFVNYTMNYN